MFSRQSFHKIRINWLHLLVTIVLTTLFSATIFSLLFVLLSLIVPVRFIDYQWYINLGLQLLIAFMTLGILIKFRKRSIMKNELAKASSFLLTIILYVSVSFWILQTTLRVDLKNSMNTKKITEEIIGTMKNYTDSLEKTKGRDNIAGEDFSKLKKDLEKYDTIDSAKADSTGRQLTPNGRQN